MNLKSKIKLNYKHYIFFIFIILSYFIFYNPLIKSFSNSEIIYTKFKCINDTFDECNILKDEFIKSERFFITEDGNRKTDAWIIFSRIDPYSFDIYFSSSENYTFFGNLYFKISSHQISHEFYNSIDQKKSQKIVETFVSKTLK